MIDAPAYQWHQIEIGAQYVTLPMRHYPYLERALSDQGVVVDRDWPAETVRKVCANLLKMQTILAGDDE